MESTTEAVAAAATTAESDATAAATDAVAAGECLPACHHPASATCQSLPFRVDFLNAPPMVVRSKKRVYLPPCLCPLFCGEMFWCWCLSWRWYAPLAGAIEVKGSGGGQTLGEKNKR